MSTGLPLLSDALGLGMFSGASAMESKQWGGEAHDGPTPGHLEAVILCYRPVEASLRAALGPGETLSPEDSSDSPGHEPRHGDDGDDGDDNDGSVGDVLRLLLGLDGLLIPHHNILNVLLILVLFVWCLRDGFVAGDMLRSDDKKMNIFFWRQIRLWHRDEVTSTCPIGTGNSIITCCPIGRSEVGRGMLVKRLF